MRNVTQLTLTLVTAIALTTATAEVALACRSGCTPPAPPSRPVNPHGPIMPGSNAIVNNKVVVNNSVNVNNSVGSGVRYGNIAGGFYGGGGGYSNWSQTPNYPQAVGLNVQMTDVMETYSEQVSSTKTMIVRASCIDSKGIPHPASQVTNDKAIASGHAGELYRCIAGTRLVIEMAEYDQALGDKTNFTGGRTIECANGQALWHTGGQLSCRAQMTARDCNERSLLRKFGAGYKIITLTTMESITRTRKVAQSGSCTAGCGMSTMVFDGGVGGYVQ